MNMTERSGNEAVFMGAAEKLVSGCHMTRQDFTELLSGYGDRRIT